jgi:stage II sporulation protein D
MVCLANDTLLRTDQPVQVSLARSALQIRSAAFNRWLSLTDTLTIAATGALLVGPVKTVGKFAPRPYSGILKIYGVGDELCVVNLVPVEDYLAGILAAEMAQADLPALQAQAVVSRTYIAKNRRRHQSTGYQFCDLTHCQAYKGLAGVTSKIRKAVTSTQAEILTFEHKPIEVYYSSTCGGLTADDVGVWENGVDQPYLKSISDSVNHASFCAQSPHFRWRLRLSADSLHQIWQRRFGEPIQSISITKKGADGRVRELALMGNSLHLISGEDFRAVTCRAFGWNTLKSTAFDLRFAQNYYIFTGRGLGHGLGLCQYGAMSMAQQGYSYREILRHYFPGAVIEKHLKNRED